MNLPDDRTDQRHLDIAAPPDAVFAAIANPARLARWWGPAGFANTIHRFEFEDGGLWQLTMHGPDGKHYPNESRFRAIVPGRSVLIEHLSGHHFLLAIELAPQAGGTRVSWRQTFDTPEHYAAIASFVATANQQNLERLAAEMLGPASPG